MTLRYISKRADSFEASGIRKVFDLAAKLSDPINLSIGQPDFDVPEAGRSAMIDAINSKHSGYTQTQGLPQLREAIQKQVDVKYGHSDRSVFISSGTSGALTLALLATIDAGDEVIFFEPYFVMYHALTCMVGGLPVPVSTYPDFSYDIARLADAITPRTKAIILNSPANPTGKVASRAEVKAIAELAAKRDILLISDEIYKSFCYCGDFVSPAEYNERTLVLDGFSKANGMPGWRVGFVHGQGELIEQMLKFQQYTFVCAPNVGQWGALAVIDVDMTEQIESYRQRRDLIYNEISDIYEINKPEGAFYMFPKVPQGYKSASEFVERGINEFSLLVIPGNVFSSVDTHFRISYSASKTTIERGIDALKKLAQVK
ncbi:MAG: aminotransferase class I/II-fold pyridoxal phosphate-dependent enzyme [Planctomycetaceae bacterium]|jgi:aspartate aminotransferase/aminotransferase|nr:aminotransferase class I/II-fold pyridoxal phosphate-dependent enzyme [Planctomycetaceae bacterium]